MEADRIPVEQLMSTDLVTVTSDATAAAAAETLLGEGVGSLVVYDRAGEFAGVVTSTDLIEIVSADGAGAGRSVSDYMTTDVVTVNATDSVHDAAVTMIRERIQHLPVTGEEGDVVGMLSATDTTAQLTYILSSGAD